MDISKDIAALFEQLKTFFQTETVIGESIQVGNITMIPVISVTFGAGNGAGAGKDNKGMDGGGGGAGAGGKITPTAMIVIKDDKVSVLPLTSRGSLETIMEMVPDVVSKMHSHKTGHAD